MKHLFVTLLVLPSLVLAQRASEKTLQAIVTAQDLRDAKSLATFLVDMNAETRSLAAFACGSLQDTSQCVSLIDLLDDKDSDVRSASAFALGQMSPVADSTLRVRISRALQKRLGLEKNRLVVLRVIESLGKMGTEFSLPVMVASAEAFPTSAMKCEAALSVGRYAYRSITSKTATAFAVNVLNTTRTGDEWKAAYALMRITDAALLENHTAELVKFASHPNADVRMFVATALGRIASSKKVANALLSLSISDTDWRVRVNALKALTQVDTTYYIRMIPLLLQVCTDSNEHVAATAVAALGDMQLARSSFRERCTNLLTSVIVDGTFQRRTREAAISLTKLAGTDAFSALTTKYNGGQLSKSSYIAALANVPFAQTINTLVRFSADSDRQIQRQALESLLTAVKAAHKDSGFVPIAKPAFISALQSSDMAVITTAASALADAAFADENSISQLSATLHQLKSPEDTEALVAVIQALGDLNATGVIAPLESKLNDPDRIVASEAAAALQKITGKSHAHLLKPHSTPSHTNFDWQLLEQIRRSPSVLVETSKGNITIEMLPAEAPCTCINFATLINKKFFDGLVFHRVVPNFVIQGGDPRGDGWGGPGYAMRSEFGYERYTRGVVGVASSGKDTEGCQWFVTHCNTPHLDGRYTIFARVTSGMDVVDKIQVGDKILKMNFSRDTR